MRFSNNNVALYTIYLGLKRRLLSLKQGPSPISLHLLFVVPPPSPSGGRLLWMVPKDLLRHEPNDLFHELDFDL